MSTPASVDLGLSDSSSESSPDSEDLDDLVAVRSKATATLVVLGGFLAFYKDRQSILVYSTAYTDKRGGKLKRSRTVKPTIRKSNEGRGRPIGLLCAWLAHLQLHSELETPSKFKPSFVKRSEARAGLESFCDHHELDAFLSM